MAYCTVDDLKRYLGIASTTTSDDVLLSGLIESAQTTIDSFTGRTFESSSDGTRYFDAVMDVYGRELVFDADICSITTVTNGDGTTVTSSEYVTSPRNVTPYYSIKLLGSSTQSWTYSTDPENAITIVGRWAYSTTAPNDIEHATRRLAAYLYRQKDNANDLDRAVVVGNATVLPSQLPSDVKQLVAPYIKRVP